VGIEALQAMDMSDDNEDNGMGEEDEAAGEAMAVDGPSQPSGRPLKGKVSYILT
jgi:hypothetical protein